jgi:hypothetical protein
VTRPRVARRDDRGAVAIITVALSLVLFGLAAFACDVGRWYVATKQTQRAADAAALAGVPYLPGDPSGAFAAAQDFANRNGFKNGTSGAVVTPAIDNTPTRLRVTVSQRVQGIFGGLLGIKAATIQRSGVADYAGPVPLGSPCNEYGNDPDSASIRSNNCSNTGQFWGNIGAPGAPKGNGDAYQDGCTGTVAGTDGCTNGTNINYDPDGYFYTLTLTQDVADLASRCTTLR